MIGKMKKDHKTITIKPRHVDIKKFNNYAVYVSKDFSNICFCLAKISEPKTKHCVGVIPSNSKNTFNCCVGEYDQDFVDILIWAPDVSLPRVQDYFGVLYTDKVWANINDIYEITISSDSLNRLRSLNYGYSGFFTDKDMALNKILYIRKKYIQDLETSLKFVKSEDTIKESLNGLKTLKEKNVCN